MLTGHILYSKCVCLLDFLLKEGQKASLFAMESDIPHVPNEDKV